MSQTTATLKDIIAQLEKESDEDEDMTKTASYWAR